MSYITMPEPITYWHIEWDDGTTSRWPTKWYTEAQVDALKTVAAYVKVNAAGIPIP